MNVLVNVPWVRSIHGFNVVTADREHSVAEVKSVPSKNETEQRQVAALIAAAPSLLHACEGAVDLLRNGELQTDREQEVKLRVVLALLSAAIHDAYPEATG